MWNLAHLVVIVADAQKAAADGGGLSKREVMLAGSVVHEGRCLLVVLNKLDTLPDNAAQSQARLLPLLPYLPALRSFLHRVTLHPVIPGIVPYTHSSS